MDILTLIPTHNKLRTPRNLDFFRKNQVNPIALSRVCDKLYVHDGHHRLVSYILEGKRELDDNIFKITDFSIDDYLEISPSKGWVTPFNIETECRLPDFFNFKRTVLECWYFGKDISHFYEIDTHKEPRKIFSMKELADLYDTKICKNK